MQRFVLYYKASMVTPHGGILDHAIEYPNFKVIVFFFFQACISSVLCSVLLWRFLIMKLYKPYVHYCTSYSIES